MSRSVSAVLHREKNVQGDRCTARYQGTYSAARLDTCAEGHRARAKRGRARGSRRQKHMTTESERETIAARWLIEQDDPDFSDGQRAELTRWIMQSADNCNTYVRLVRAWRWAVLLHRAEPPIVHRKAAPVGSSSRKSKVDHRFGD